MSAIGVTYDSDSKLYIIRCPNCHEVVTVDQINCGMFVHAAFKDHNKQIDPHISQQQMTNLLDMGVMYGCGAAFRFDGFSLPSLRNYG